jgi:hypothetical protein
MLSLRKRALAALALSLALALPASAAAPAASYEKYLPDTADGVITINVRQLLDSELIKKAGLDKALANEEAQKSMKALGFDPLKDIERLVVTSDKDGSEEQALFIVQGKFDQDKLGAAITEHAKEAKDHLKVHKTDNGTIYELTKLDELVKVPPQAAGANINLKGKSVFAVIADKGNIVFSGSKESAETVLAKAAGKKTTKLKSKELAALLAKINPKQTIAVAFPAPAGEEKVKSITGGITVSADVKLDFTVTATDAGAAKEIDEKIKEQLGMAKDIAGIVVMQQKELEPVVDILASVKHDAKDNTVGITSDIKGETLEKLAKAIKSLAEKGGIGK